MPEFTYYDILGLSYKASDIEIKEAYKERARYYHPDVTTLAIEVAQAQLKIINEAYRALSSPEKRKEYDSDLIARKELSLLGEFSEVVEGLFKGKFKRSIATLQEVIAKAPESDIPHGLLATAHHMQAIAAYESKKYEVAQGLLKQALDIGFEDISLRKSIKHDLAVVEHRLRAPVPLTDLGTIVKEMVSVNKHNAIRALTALTNGDFEGDRGKAIAAAVNLAGRSLHRDVRVVALKALSAIDEKNKG
ncbi:MAG TPA: J domain-containing protein, partial [Chroococcales cyanobacterium]